ncbi:hypothetical protein BH23ACT10_BH23ACT10_32720 [soil metagenome]
MTWEEPPQRPDRRRWLVPVGIGLAVLAALAVVILPRTSPPSMLTVGPSSPPGDGDLTNSNPQDFVPDRLPPLTTATETPGQRPLLPNTDLTIVAVDDTGLQFVDTATGDVRRVQLVDTAAASFTETVFIVGDSIVVDANADVVRIRDGDVRPLRIARNHRAIPTIDDTSVWVFDNFSSFVNGTASRVDFEGEVRDQIRLPAVVQPLVGTADGLVVSAPGAISQVATDGSARLIARGMAVAADNERIAWLQCTDDLSCAVVLGTIDDPEQARTTLDPAALPAGFFDIPVGRFSPDGRWLALPLYRTRGRRAVEKVTVTVIDTTTGVEVFREDGSSVTGLDQPLAWSPDSEWLMFMSRSEIHAWRAGDEGSTAIDAELRGVRALAVR